MAWALHEHQHLRQRVQSFLRGTAGMHQHLIGPEETKRLQGILEGLGTSQDEDRQLLDGKRTSLCKLILFLCDVLFAAEHPLTQIRPMHACVRGFTSTGCRCN